MSGPRSSDETIWSAALRDALAGRPGRTGGLLLFFDERQDVTVELDGLKGPPDTEHSRSCGLAAHGPSGGGRFRFQADPEVADVERLVSKLRNETPESTRIGSPGPDPARPGRWLPVEEAARLVEKCINATGKLHRRAEIRARWVGFDQRIRVARTDRGVVADRRRGSRLRLEANLRQHGRVSRSVGEMVLDPDFGGAPDTTIEKLAGQVARRVEERMAAKPLLSGEYPIVFSPGVGGVLIHEIVGHALEADTVLGRVSWLEKGTGSFAGSPELLVVDDPRRGRAAWRLDDEGEPARATSLMREGRVSGWLHDLASARRSDRAPTGHGRRTSFREPVRPRMGCTFLAPGRFEAEEALENLENGIYVRRMEAASTDTRTGQAVFRVTDADRIHNGRLDRPLSPHLMFVDAAEALSSVQRVANDLEFDVCVGSCLHHGQPLSISVGGPTFRIGLTRVRF